MHRPGFEFRWVDSDNTPGGTSFRDPHQDAIVLVLVFFIELVVRDRIVNGNTLFDRVVEPELGLAMFLEDCTFLCLCVGFDLAVELEIGLDVEEGVGFEELGGGFVLKSRFEAALAWCCRGGWGCAGYCGGTGWCLSAESGQVELVNVGLVKRAIEPGSIAVLEPVGQMGIVRR